MAEASAPRDGLLHRDSIARRLLRESPRSLCADRGTGKGGLSADRPDRVLTLPRSVRSRRLAPMRQGTTADASELATAFGTAQVVAQRLSDKWWGVRSLHASLTRTMQRVPATAARWSAAATRSPSVVPPPPPHYVLLDSSAFMVQIRATGR